MASIKKPKLRSKKTETIRERAEKQRIKQANQPRRKKVANATSKPVKGLGMLLKKEYTPIKIKKGKYSSILSKRISLMPKYIVESFNELKQVNWLKPKQAISLTFAVIVFSVSIALLVQLLGFVFDKLVQEVILK